MPKKITAYQAEDGTIHDSECAAATRDVEIMVQASPLAENAPFARQLVDWLTANPKLIRERLEAHEKSCPKNLEGQAPSKTLERTRSSERTLADGD